MNRSVMVLYICNFVFIGMLPLSFFKRDGRFNLMWLLTSAPFFACSIFLFGIFFGLINPAEKIRSEWGTLLDIATVPFSVASIALLCFTVGTHRIPLALWHQTNDAPQHIVTYGPYRWVRHPFYVSFLLALGGMFIYYPHLTTLITLSYGIVMLNGTADREEKRLCGSEFGTEYADYMKRTGRFVPKWKGSTL